MSSITGCHLVGSTGLSDTEASLRQCTSCMPDRLKRIPDGETGPRHYFTGFQTAFFSAVPELVNGFERDNSYVATLTAVKPTPTEVSAAVETLRGSRPETGYDTAAIESYQIFKRLRDEGAVPKGVRFQVSLPGLANVIPFFVKPEFQEAAASVYEEALFRAMRNIQSQIPHEDLAIQIDLAGETFIWEGVLPLWTFMDAKDVDKKKQYVVDFIARMMGQVDQDVELGVHNCYGDIDHKHLIELKSLATITERGLMLFEKSPHPIQFWHVPVPVSAMDFLDEYYQPMRDLLPKFKQHGTDVYLGVVQYDDEEGTKTRIDGARKNLPGLGFGIATECGLGRTPAEEIDGIMKLSWRLSDPVQ